MSAITVIVSHSKIHVKDISKTLKDIAKEEIKDLSENARIFI